MNGAYLQAGSCSWNLAPGLSGGYGLSRILVLVGSSSGLGKIVRGEGRRCVSENGDAEHLQWWLVIVGVETVVWFCLGS